MKRYLVTFLSLSTGTPVVLNESDSPAEAYQHAQKANAEGMRDVRVADAQVQDTFDLKTFAAMHKL